MKSKNRFAERPERILICVTRQKTCEHLITYGAEMAKTLNAELFVVHFVRVGDTFLGNPLEGEALEYLYSVSSGVGAEMTVLRCEDVSGAIADYAGEIGATGLIMGKSPDKRKRFEAELKNKLPDVRFEII